MTALKKSIWIDADPDTVFAYLTEGDRLALWCGRAAELDARPGGIYRLDMGAAGILQGRFVEVVRPGRIVYEVGAAEHQPEMMSRVEITLSAEVDGTRVEVAHDALPPPFRPVAGRGWDHHLARLSVVASGGDPGPDALCERPMESLMGIADG